METLLYDFADEVRERALKANVSRIECSRCSEGASVVDAHGVANMVRHALHGHATVTPLLGVTYSEVVSPYETTARLGGE